MEHNYEVCERLRFCMGLDCVISVKVTVFWAFLVTFVFKKKFGLVGAIYQLA